VTIGVPCNFLLYNNEYMHLSNYHIRLLKDMFKRFKEKASIVKMLGSFVVLYKLTENRTMFSNRKWHNNLDSYSDSVSIKEDKC